MGTTAQYATLLALLVFSCMQLHRCHGAPTLSCREDERKALLQFKHGLKDPSGMLSSWVGMDCCSWLGVTCSNRTGRVIQLDLRGSFITGRRMKGDEIDPCLLALQGLEYLDLSYNDFSMSPIPKFIGSFKRLRHLDLTWSSLVGSIPPELGNLSSLRYLDLSWISGGIEDDSWLSRLSSLHYLDLTYVAVKNFSHALQSIGMLPLLSELHMLFCMATTSPHDDLPLHVNFTSLKTLDLRSNRFNTTLPSWLFEISSLEHLDLSGNNFMGHVPSQMANLTSLEFLDLSENKLLEGDSLYNVVSKLDNVKELLLSHMDLKGGLQRWLGDRRNLEYLDLSYNQLNGTLTQRSLGQLSNVVGLHLSANYFNGILTDAHFRNLTRLETLDLSLNSLEIRIRSDWTPPPLLIDLDLDDCKVGQAFPAWLRKVEYISEISMSNAEISDVMPEWFWNFSLMLSSITLSNNMIQGKLPASLQHLENLSFLDLSNNPLEGPFPQLPEKLQELFLSNTSISWPIPPNVSQVAGNKLNGGIPSSLCELKELIVLDISGNHLLGEIPDCFDSKSQLSSVDLSNNELSGTIPSSFCSLRYLGLLQLQRNNLSGPLPSALKNCKILMFIDLGNNKFNGSIPTWLGSMLTNLIVLSLKSNMFVGQIPKELGNLSSLGIIDLSHNMLSGPIPQSFANLTAIKHSNAYGFEFAYDGLVDVMFKGRDQEYEMLSNNFPTSIDLSSNNLSGKIPKALTTLDGLQNLNLSNNHLRGTIPMSIMGLQYLESLDLSFNNLTGEIPQTMADLYFLSYMNFSFNQLRGRIPSGGQFENHPDPSIYLGNADLCGFPLNISCQRNVTNQPSLNIDNDKQVEDHENVWFFVSAALGFVIAFWAFIGSLLLKTQWRIAYYGYIDQVYDKVYVFVVVNLVRIRHR